MAKSSQALLIAALCFFGLLGFAYCHDDFKVVGSVYCDTCRALFVTRVSQPVPNAPIKLECRSRDNGTITHSVESKCDELGDYRVTVEGEHQEDICEVVLLDSPVSNCAEKVRGRDRARIVLTHNNGVVSSTRYANPLGFLADKPLEVCADVLKELDLLPTIDFALPI
ncbi:olee1-like protein [Macadamia integrifolia]|uniref:olee1-like protein n=1 Tax=Macadamia integrifolia TaxID=60698 RepID=UPI001C527A45|nr:olee1-like protein [Macadamia integrifolia]